MTAEELDLDERVTRSRRSAGLPDRIDDEATVERIAAMVRASTTDQRPAERPREVVASSDRILEPAGRWR